MFEQVRGLIEHLSPDAIAGRPCLLVTGKVDTKARESADAKGFERAFERLFAVQWERHGERASAA